MSILLVQLLVDFGLVVLIWMIQLIVYPSFLYYSSKNLLEWHKRYTILISFIVMPLMLIQLGVSGYQLVTTFSLFIVIRTLLIVTIWIITFLRYVPLHNAITKGDTNQKLLKGLVHTNWWRTILWTLLFLWNLVHFTFYSSLL